MTPATAPMPPQAVHSLRLLPDGDAGVRETLREMRSIVRAWRVHPLIRELAVELTAGCPDKDWACEARTLHAWVRDHIRFASDVAEVETLQTPELTLRTGAGDCDDQCILLASLLQAIGHPVRFIAVDMGNGFSHVFCETLIGAYWVAAETTERWAFGQRPPGVRRYMVQQV